MRDDLAIWHAFGREMLALLPVLLDRLNANGLAGEEAQWIADCRIGLEMARCLPVNHQAARAFRWPGHIQEMVDAAAAESLIEPEWPDAGAGLTP